MSEESALSEHHSIAQRLFVQPFHHVTLRQYSKSRHGIKLAQSNSRRDSTLQKADNKMADPTDHSTKEERGLFYVQENIIQLTDGFYSPVMKEFLELGTYITKQRFGGDDAASLQAVFEATATYEVNRWTTFMQQVEGFRTLSLPEARQMLHKLHQECRRLAQVFDDMEFMKRRCRVGGKSGKLAPRIGIGCTVFRRWHEMRREDDMTSLLEICDQAARKNACQ